MTVGRYAGTPVDRLPNSYLRWIITQGFSKEIIDAAKSKLEDSDYSDLYLSVSRHALDMFSKRLLSLWIQSEGGRGDEAEGIATFVAKLAQEAWEEGEDVSKRRHQNDGIIKEWKDVKWVFGVNPDFPDYKDVITVMHSIDEQ